MCYYSCKLGEIGKNVISLIRESLRNTRNEKYEIMNYICVLKS